MVERRGSRKPTEDDVALGRSLRTLRIKSGFTQHKLATHLEISSQQLSKYESGRNRISAGMLDRATAFLIAASAPSEDERYTASEPSPPRGLHEARRDYGTDNVLERDVRELVAIAEKLRIRFRG